MQWVVVHVCLVVQHGVGTVEYVVCTNVLRVECKWCRVWNILWHKCVMNGSGCAWCGGADG